MDKATERRSNIHIHGFYERECCGYCKGNKSTAYGISAKDLLVEDYEKLMLVGWRRSGVFLYKPTMHKTCCPQYTIRLPVSEYKQSKQHKQVLKRVQRYLSTGFTKVQNNNGNDSHGINLTNSVTMTSNISSINHLSDESLQAPSENSISSDHPQHHSIASNHKISELSSENEEMKLTSQNVKDTSSTLSSSLSSPTNIITSTTSPLISSSNITIETVSPEATMERFELYKKYQITVHHDKPQDITLKSFTRFLVTSPLITGQFIRNQKDIKVIKISNTEIEKNKDLKDIIDINNEQINSKYKEKNHQKDIITAEGVKYGTFHQLYRLNNKLIAVGVIDILPSGISSVYVFYDDDYNELCLGKYTALKEIEFAKEHGFQYYYMGYYIHSNTKMRYKGDYKPSDLLCATSLEWRPLAECLPMLDKFVFSPFREDLAQQRARIPIGYTKQYITEKENNNLTESILSNNETTVEMIIEEREETKKREEDQNDNNITEMISEPIEEMNVDHVSNKERKIEEENNNKEDYHSLEIFAPQYSDFDSNSIPLDIGYEKYLYLNQLNAKGKEIVTPILDEWKSVCPTELLSKIVIMLC